MLVRRPWRVPNASRAAPKAAKLSRAPRNGRTVRKEAMVGPPPIERFTLEGYNAPAGDGSVLGAPYKKRPPAINDPLKPGPAPLPANQ